jgi:hypothetical protein
MMVHARLFAIVPGALCALGLAACAHHPQKAPTGGGLAMPVMPLAQGHIPPVPQATPDAAQAAAVLPMRIGDVSRAGRVVRVAWDAPGATSAIVAFSSDGTAFETVARTGEPDAQFVPASTHGIIRIIVTDGKRRNSLDYRI